MKKLLFLLLFIPNMSIAGQEKEAITKAGEAFYKQSGLERYVNKFIEKNVNDDLRNWTGNAFLVYKVIEEQKITYTWNF